MGTDWPLTSKDILLWENYTMIEQNINSWGQHKLCWWITSVNSEEATNVLNYWIVQAESCFVLIFNSGFWEEGNWCWWWLTGEKKCCRASTGERTSVRARCAGVLAGHCCPAPRPVSHRPPLRTQLAGTESSETDTIHCHIFSPDNGMHASG